MCNDTLTLRRFRKCVCVCFLTATQYSELYVWFSEELFIGKMRSDHHCVEIRTVLTSFVLDVRHTAAALLRIKYQNSHLNSRTRCRGSRVCICTCMTPQCLYSLRDGCIYECWPDTRPYLKCNRIEFNIAQKKDSCLRFMLLTHSVVLPMQSYFPLMYLRS